MGRKPDFTNILELLVATKSALPLTFCARSLGFVPDCRETKQLIDKVNEAVSSLLYVLDDRVYVFHKSVYDWLLAKGYKKHEYTVEVGDGTKRLWQLCEQVFEEIKATVSSGHDLKLTN